jgi:hypothetical protein
MKKASATRPDPPYTAARMHGPPAMVFLQDEKKPRYAGAEGMLRRCAAHT